MAVVMKCRNIETVTFILAVIMAVISGIGILSSIGGMIYFNIFWKQNLEEIQNLMNKHGTQRTDGDIARNANKLISKVFLNLINLLVLMLFGGDFTMNTILCHGVYKIRPGFIKGWFYYGVLKCSIFTIVAAALCGCELILPGALIFLAIGIHVPILVAVYKTMKKFEAGLQNIPMENEDLEKKYIT